jgi:hypothetical protein
MCRTLIAASLAAFFLVGQAASAQPGLSYDYLDLSYVDLDFDDFDFDMDGFAVSGSMSFTDEWFGTLGYADFSGSERFNGESFKADIDRLDLRVGYRHGIDANLDLVASGGYVRESGKIRLDLGDGDTSSASDSEDGWVIGVGVRFLATEVFELGFNFDRFDVGGSFNEVGVRALWHASPNFSLGAGYVDGDDYSFISLTGRYNF